MEEKEIHLRDYVRVVRKRKGIVIAVFLITLLVVVIGTFTAVPLYQASAKILVEKNEANPLGRYYYYASQDPEFIATQSQIITSKRVSLKVVKLLNLEKDFDSYFPENKKGPSFVKSVTSWVKTFILNLANISSSKEEGAAVPLADMDSEDQLYTEKEGSIADVIRDGIKVTPVQESKVFNISFMSETPIFAKRVANTLATAYMEELLEMKMHSSGYTIKWMTQKVDEERARLEKSEKELQSYMQAKDIITIEDRITILPQKLAEFSSQMNKAETERKELDVIYQQVRKAKDSGIDMLESIPAISATPEIQALRAQLLVAEQKIAELSEKYGPKHPAMIKAIGEMEALNAKKKEETNRLIQSIRSEYELAQAKEDSLRNMFESTKAETMGLNEKFIQYEVLKREVESNRTIYDALLSRLKEQDITEETQSVSVWIVEKAETPLRPIKPNKKRNLMLGLVLGLFGGVGLAFFIEYLDNTVKTPEEAEERLGLPMLGTIERFKGKKKKVETELMSLQNQQSTAAESFKALRTSLLLSSSDKPPKSIVVTSMLPGEGKTTIAANLAITIAQAGQRVLLIDGDMRKPRLHRIFKLESKTGLSTFLAGASGPDIIQDGPLDTLKIIAAGPLPPNPSELLSSKKLPELLGLIENDFDIVIFDSAPVLPVSDTLVISKSVDGVLVVTRAAQTTYEVVEKGTKSLMDIQAHILGLVVNDFDARKYKYYYGRYYNQYYGNYGADA